MTDKQREYIEKKARELIDRIDDVYPALRSITYWENFVLNLLNEAPMRKVSMEFVRHWCTEFIEDYHESFKAEQLDACIIEMLKEVGVEVE